MTFFRRKNGIYYIKFWDETEQKEKRVSTGKRTKREALKFLSNYQQYPKIKTTTTKILLSKFKDEYREYVEKTYSKNYLRSIELSFRMLTREIGDVRLEKITIRDIENFVATKFSSSQNAAALYYRTCKAAFNKAVSWGYLDTNPFKSIKLPKIKTSHPSFITEQDLGLIIKNSKNELLNQIFIFAFNCGLRVGEIVNLKWGAVDLENRILTVKNNEAFVTKSKKERIVPINNKLYKVLNERSQKLGNISNNEFVFYRVRGVRINEDFISKKFKEAVRLAGFDEHIHMHTLRHSFASNLIQRGVSIYVIKELLGHQDISTTQIYSHLQNKNLFDAVKLLDIDPEPNKEPTC